MSFILLFSSKSKERNVKQRPACLGAVICDWRLGRRRVGLGDHLQRVVIDRLEVKRGGWDLNLSQEENHSHPQRGEGWGGACRAGRLPGEGKGLAGGQQLSVGVLLTGLAEPRT